MDMKRQVGVMVIGGPRELLEYEYKFQAHVFICVTY
jgi:hypothetical protein